MSKVELDALASQLGDLFRETGYAITPEVVEMARQMDGIIADSATGPRRKAPQRGPNLSPKFSTRLLQTPKTF